MPHQIQNCSVHRNTDQDLTIEVDLLNLTGSTVVWRMKRHMLADDADALIEKSSVVAGEVYVASPATDQSIVRLTAADLAVDPGVYYHVAMLTDTAGNDSLILDGSFEVDP